MKGSIAPKELLRILDAEAVQKYIVDEVQKVYRSQSVEISDTHIEIIVRQMMRKLTVVQEGDTDLLPGRDVSINDYKKACSEVIANGGKLPIAKPLLLGITKAALASDSFLSASSFQETTRILTSAAIQSKSDSLIGLKENTLIGGLIPAGTGILVEDTFECEHKPVDEEEIEDLEEKLENDESSLETEEEFEDEQDDSLSSDFIDEAELLED